MHIKIITGPACNKCHFVAPILKQWAEKNGYTFEEKDISIVTPEEIWEATSLPITRFGEEQIDYDTLLWRIS